MIDPLMNLPAALAIVAFAGCVAANATPVVYTYTGLTDFRYETSDGFASSGFSALTTDPHLLNCTSNPLYLQNQPCIEAGINLPDGEGAQLYTFILAANDVSEIADHFFYPASVLTTIGTFQSSNPPAFGGLLEVAYAPEPSTWALMMSSLLCLCFKLGLPWRNCRSSLSLRLK